MSNESFFDKVKDFVTGHPEQADQGLDKAEEIINERTGGKYAEQIDKGDDLVSEQLGLPDDEASASTPEPARRPETHRRSPATHAHAGDRPGAATRADADRADPDAAGARPGPGTDVAARDGPGGRAGHLRRDRARPPDGPAAVPGPGLGQASASLISASTVPLVTVAPTSAVRPATRRRPCGR